MATSELEILITATNQAKEALDEVAKGILDVSRELEKLLKEQEKLGGKGESVKNLKELDRALNVIANRTKEAADASREAAKANKEQESSVRRLVRGAAVAAAAFFSFREALRFVATGVREAAQTQRLDTALRTLGEQAGITTRQVNASVRAIEAFGVSGGQARDTARRLLQANLDIANGARLAEAAQRIGLATGEATDAVLQKITFAVQTGNTVLLKRAGIVIDQTAAEEELAASLGIAASALTQQQQQQAVANAVIAESAKLAGIAGEAIGNFSTRLADLPRLTADLAEVFGTALLPGLNELIGSFTLFIRNLRQSAQQFLDSTNFSENFTASMRLLGNTLTAITPALTALLRIIGLIASAFFGLTSSIEGLIAVGLLIIRFIPGWGQVIAAVVLVVQLLSEAGIDLSKVFEVVLDALRVFGNVALLIFGETLDRFRLFALGVQEVWARAMRFIGRTTKDEFDKTIKDINAQRAQIQTAARERFTQALTGAGRPGGRSAEVDKVVAEREKIKAINEEILKSENDAIAARKSGDAAALASSVFKIRQLEKERAGIEENIAKIEEQRLAETSLGKERDARAAAGAAERAERERIKAVNDAFRSLIQGQGLVAAGFNGMSQAGSKAVGELETVLLDLGVKLKANAEVDLPKTRAAILGAFGQLKTVQDFTAAIDKLNVAIEQGATQLTSLRQEAAFRQQQIALTQINSEMTFFVNALEQVRNLQTTYNQLVADGVQDNIALRQVQAAITNDRRAQAALELQSIAVQLSSARQRFDNERDLIQRNAQQQAATARQSITDARSSGAAIRAIDNQKTQALLTNAKTYYDALRVAQNQFLQQFQAAAQRVRDIDQNLAAGRRSTANEIRDLQRSTFSEEGKQFDRRRELQEQEAAFRSAFLRQDDAASQAAIERQKELARQIASGAGDPTRNAFEAARVLENVQSQSEELALRERALAAETAANAKANFEAVGTELAALTTQIQSLVGQQVVNLQVQVEQTALDAAVQQVKNAFSGLVIQVPIQPILGVGESPQVSPTQPGGLGFARGGRVPGSSPSTSADNILAWLTAGEWVHPVRAVRYWGEDFMRAIDNMRMPRFSDGGPVRRFAEGGPVPAAPNRLAAAINQLTSATSGLASAKSAFQSERLRPVVLDMGSLGTFEVQGNDKTVESLKKAISQAAIKRRRS